MKVKGTPGANRRARGSLGRGKVVRKITRREFLRVAAGSGGAFMAAGFGVKATDNLIPYVVPPEDIRPGVVTYFATTCRECPAGCGMHRLEPRRPRHQGRGQPRPPDQPRRPVRRGQSARAGAVRPRPRARADAAGLTRRRRPQTGRVERRPSPRSAGASRRQGQGRPHLRPPDRRAGRGDGGACRRPSTRPSRCTIEPFNYEPVRAANEALLARAAIPDYRIDLCDFLISFGADFLETWISPVQFARRFAEMRQPRDGKAGRFVYVGPRLSMTAANADEFIQVSAGRRAGGGDGDAAAIMVEKGWAKGDAGAVKSLLARRSRGPAGGVCRGAGGGPRQGVRPGRGQPGAGRPAGAAGRRRGCGHGGGGPQLCRRADRPDRRFLPRRTPSRPTATAVGPDAAASGNSTEPTRADRPQRQPRLRDARRGRAHRQGRARSSAWAR